MRLLVVLLLILTGCQEAVRSPRAEAPLSEKALWAMAQLSPDPYWQKRWWLEKTARRLRAGNGLTEADNVAALMKLSEDDAIRELMKDVRFGDAMFDFNTYFLGFKADAIKVGDYYAPNAMEMSGALHAAREMINGGDYFKLFDMKGPVYTQPLGDARRYPGEEALNPTQARKKHAAELQTYFQDALAFTQLPETTGEAACAKLIDYTKAFQGVLSDGYPLKLFFQGLLLNPERGQRIKLLCDGFEPPNKQELIAAIQDILKGNTAFFAEMSKFEEADGYRVSNINDFRAVDLKNAGLGDSWITVGFDQASTISNSSTNMNRRRGAYMLKQYFCDDLTPVGFESPETHVGGQHGSDTSCYACHFKLDPMSGFFRTYGNIWGDFANSKRIIFDDGAIVNRPEYENNWRSNDPAKRAWNVGYVRSARTESANDYGESLDDLTRILRRAPEVKQCLVRRMFEYFVADQQTVDAGYLHALAEQLEDEATENSSVAAKNTLVRLLTSNAAHERNMDPQQCYDFAPGEDPSQAPPCRVAYLLRKNCVACHSSAGPAAGLNLERWIDAGGIKSFPHLDAEGKQIDHHTTFTALADRLSTSDTAKRMPLKRVMAEPDRRELFLWAQEQLSENKP